MPETLPPPVCSDDKDDDEPLDSSRARTMQGFVHDYCNNFVVTRNRVPTFDEYRAIMDSFTPDTLPANSASCSIAWACACRRSPSRPTRRPAQ
jgi:hypothetical protein